MQESNAWEYAGQVNPVPHASTRADRRRGDRVLHVLIADDDRDTVSTLSAILEAEGHVVQPVFNGVEVLPAVRFFRPDAVFLDMALPGMSGYAIAQAIRFSFTDIRRPLLVAISGVWKEPAERVFAQHAGFDHYLVKPCDPRVLLQLLSRLRS
jgi:DNA-binding response OmpR family regulator